MMPGYETTGAVFFFFFFFVAVCADAKVYLSDDLEQDGALFAGCWNLLFKEVCRNAWSGWVQVSSSAAP